MKGNPCGRPRGPWPALIAALAAALSLYAPAATPSETSRPPVVLFDPKPTLPIEAIDSPIAPEATVQVSIDAKGRVTQVEILSLTPSTEFDAAYQRSLRETIGQWRFSPKYESGSPIPTKLQWTTKFSTPESSGLRLSGSQRWDALLSNKPSRGRQFLSLPLEQRKKLLEGRVKTGLEAFGRNEVIRVSLNWFEVRTDADQVTAETIGNNLDAIYGILGRMLGNDIPLRHEPLKIQVFAYKSRAALTQFEQTAFPYESSPPGFYSRLGLIGLNLETGVSEHFLSTLIHEGTHAFFDRHLVRPGVKVPRWLTEGLAEYMSNSTIKKGQLIPGRVPRGRRTNLMMVQGSVRITRWDPAAQLSLLQIKQAAKTGKALKMSEMLDAGLAEFAGDRLGLYYGMSWLLVHYLRHGQEEWAETAFPQFLLYVAEGFPPSGAFETVYGRSVEEMEPDFRRYIANF